MIPKSSSFYHHPVHFNPDINKIVQWQSYNFVYHTKMNIFLKFHLLISSTFGGVNSIKTVFRKKVKSFYEVNRNRLSFRIFFTIRWINIMFFLSSQFRWKSKKMTSDTANTKSRLVKQIVGRSEICLEIHFFIIIPPKISFPLLSLCSDDRNGNSKYKMH